ncbi:glycosyltransferase [Paenibacillus sp. CAU 1782]
MHVLIPAYEPDERLIGLIARLKEADRPPNIIVVDDGSGVRYRELFQAASWMGCIVLTHETNRGKGCALKTGFAYLKEIGASGEVVCADSDGQHLPKDIMRVGSSVERDSRSMVLGGRRFSGKVPLRSRFGNAATRFVYARSTGVKVHDTQTGLRGYSADMLEFLLAIPGERFEYEMNVLLAAAKYGYAIKEITIDTVYLNNNESSHFRPLADSASVYLPFLKFSGSSLISGAVDFVLVLLLHSFSSSLLLAVWGARCISALLNYSLNRNVVFAKGSGIRHGIAFPRYAALAVLIACLNYLLLLMLYEKAGIPLPIAKIITEVSLFLLSYWSQKSYIFALRK